MPELLFIVGGAAVTVAACWSLGRFLFRGPEFPAGVQFGLGAALLSLPVFALLAAGIARDRALFALLAAALLPALVLQPRPRLSLPRPHPVAAAVGAVYAFLYFVHALAPEIQPDAAGYHLGLVREWLRLNGFAGRAGFYEALPHGLEMLFVPAYTLGTHSAAKLVHLAFLAATVPLAADAARRLGLSPLTGTFAGLLYASLPVVGVTGTSAYNDAALAFFALLAFDLLLAIESAPAARTALAAGLAAGFCYAIKMSGGIVAAAALPWLLYRRRWRIAGWFSLAAAGVAAPWVVRNALQYGNPAAPFFNRLFPNPYFHAATEAQLGEILRDYGGVGFAAAIPALAFDGRALQGLIGPVLLLLPLGLGALRKPRMRALPIAGLVMMLPWFLNLGARFLMPALLFFALALMAVLPRRAAAAVVVLAAVLGLPPVAGLYSDPEAWRLRGLPVRAALRIEPEAEYLSRALWTSELA
ncbi:MAG TPA: phospholipid carrier-dependent glycosyltransferase, partial [Thermopetrobacter sp.]|nr:phospholipid carrier-dependent glycosyltransferase [Thermopetrobacter sp.]